MVKEECRRESKSDKEKQRGRKCRGEIGTSFPMFLVIPYLCVGDNSIKRAKGNIESFVSFLGVEKTPFRVKSDSYN